MVGRSSQRKIKYPKVKDKISTLPPPELIEKIIDEIDRLSVKVAVALIYETGARISEIITLKRKHVIEQPEGYYPTKDIPQPNK